MIPSGSARLAGVMGWPVSHSRSPRLHGYWLDHYGIDGAYVPLAVAPEKLADVLSCLPHMGFVGANVTVPHKVAALACVDRVDETAARIGAVNTIVVDGGSLVGSNTDAFGFIENVRAGAPGWNAAGRPVVILGAGGAARAVVVALLDAGAPTIRLANRTPERARGLAREFGSAVEAVAWERRAPALADAGLVVNATSLGMTGQPPLDLPLDALPDDAVVTDIVYSPLETPLLAAARGRGNPVVDGLGMLHHQARPGFAAWFGIDPEVTDDLRAFVLDEPAGAP